MAVRRFAQIIKAFKRPSAIPARVLVAFFSAKGLLRDAAQSLGLIRVFFTINSLAVPVETARPEELRKKSCLWSPH
jgi:hypothetical protein